MKQTKTTYRIEAYRPHAGVTHGPSGGRSWQDWGVEAPSRQRAAQIWKECQALIVPNSAGFGILKFRVVKVITSTEVVIGD